MQKPERLKAFRAKESISQPDKPKDAERGKAKPLGRTKTDDKRPEELKVWPTSQAVASRQVSPPASKTSFANTGLVQLKIDKLLSKSAFELLLQIPPRQFLRRGGIRSDDPMLFSGPGYEHGAEQDLLKPEVQELLIDLLLQRAFLGVRIATTCKSFSRAVTPAVRSTDKPLGLGNISANVQEKVATGNAHAAFVVRVMGVVLDLALLYWLENPDESFLWLHPDFQKLGLGRAEGSYRFDMCRYSTPWRKQTRIATNCGLAGERRLCLGAHSHLKLRGRSAAHRCCWTKVAQTYPASLCKELGRALAVAAGLSRRWRRQIPLSSALARCQHGRIGEAAHPGPRMRPAPRDPEELLRAALHEPSTLLIQERVWRVAIAFHRDGSVGTVFLPYPSSLGHEAVWPSSIWFRRATIRTQTPLKVMFWHNRSFPTRCIPGILGMSASRPRLYPRPSPRPRTQAPPKNNISRPFTLRGNPRSIPSPSSWEPTNPKPRNNLLDPCQPEKGLSTVSIEGQGSCKSTL